METVLPDKNSGMTRKKFLALMGIGSLVVCSGLTGCVGLPGDPAISDLYTKNIFPGTDNTYDIGSPSTAYRNIWVSKLWDDVRAPVSAIKLGSINPPVEVPYRGSLLLSFEDKVLAQEQICYFAFQMPHGYKEGSDIHPHVHWVPEDGTAGNVVWQMTFSWVDHSGVFPVETTSTIVTAAGGVANSHNKNYFPLLSGVGKHISSMLVGSLKRNSSNVLDTYNGKSAYLLEVDLHYQLDSLGTIPEGSK